MCRTEQRAVIILLFCLLNAHTPADAWYKQAAGPTYYSVGRASGLLSGIRRSAIRRDERDTRDSGDFTANNEILQTNLALKTLPICVKDVLPELQSCELMQNSMFQCKAAIIITLDSTNCVNT